MNKQQTNPAQSSGPKYKRSFKQLTWEPIILWNLCILFSITHIFTNFLKIHIWISNSFVPKENLSFNLISINFLKYPCLGELLLPYKVRCQVCNVLSTSLWENSKCQGYGTIDRLLIEVITKWHFLGRSKLFWLRHYKCHGSPCLWVSEPHKASHRRGMGLGIEIRSHKKFTRNSKFPTQRFFILPTAF